MVYCNIKWEINNQSSHSKHNYDSVEDKYYDPDFWNFFKMIRQLSVIFTYGGN